MAMTKFLWSVLMNLHGRLLWTFVFVFCLFWHASVNAQLIKSGIPIIDGKIDGKMIVVNGGENLKLSCKGLQPLNWTWSDPEVMKTRYTQNSLNYSDSNHNLPIYEANLHVENTKYSDTGRFICQYSNISVIDNSTSADVYVYVFDGENLFLPLRHSIVSFRETSPESIIPCRPTHPKVNVTLLKNPYNSGNPITEDNMNFDPEKGFVVSYPSKVFDGHFKCIGVMNGKEKTSNRIILSWIGDSKNLPAPNISVQYSRTKLLTNDSFSVLCNLLLNKSLGIPIKNVHWKLPNPVRLNEISKAQMTKLMVNDTFDIYKSTLTINGTIVNDTGRYTCNFASVSNRTVSKSITVKVKPRIEPSLVISNLGGTIRKEKSGNDVNLTCLGKGAPTPITVWYKDGETIKTDTPGITFIENNTQLIISRATEENSGQYFCEIRNSEGLIADNTTLLIEGPLGLNSELEEANKTVISVGAVIGILCLFILLIVSVYIYKRKKQMRSRALLRKMLFEQGDPASIDPDLPIIDQVELLPYDKRWEFCPTNLKLGKTLGQGAFGRVIKAEAYGLLSDETKSVTVAVKLLKERQDLTQQKALLQELKIMIHLGRHVNVLNLYGACTKNIDKGELMVIVEYCSQGNLRHFLLDHRNVFVNQVNPQTGKITAGASFLFHFDEDSACSFQTNSDFSQTTEVEDFLSIGKNSTNNQKQKQRLTTTDLLCMAFQIAKGMEYLSSKKLVHRDLATRNILLTEDYIIKICDFGLAKDLYKYTIYKKQTNGPLPIKWMAIESLRDRVFSTHSDVWSYGIVLWEIFTLGSNPYPGLEVDDVFFQNLLQGYRLSKPEFASNDIYSVMTECWKERPNERPSFPDLVNFVGSQLDERIILHYVNINTICPPLLNIPKNVTTDEQSVRLSNLEDCDEHQRSSIKEKPKHYVNLSEVPEECTQLFEDGISSEYLTMDKVQPNNELAQRVNDVRNINNNLCPVSSQ